VKPKKEYFCSAVPETRDTCSDSNEHLSQLSAKGQKQEILQVLINVHDFVGDQPCLMPRTIPQSGIALAEIGVSLRLSGRWSI
jgi:hypothetical protein